MVRPQGSEATDPHAANAEVYDETVRKVFEKLEIDWRVIEERPVAVVSDGAGCLCGLLNCGKRGSTEGINQLGKGCGPLPDAAN